MRLSKQEPWIETTRATQHQAFSSRRRTTAIVAAADGREIETEWVLRTFNNDGCPALKHKPKFFILQAEILSKLNSRQPVRKKAPQIMDQPQSHIPLDEQSDYYEAAAKCFKIVSAPEKGRYAVATSDLDPGTIVLQVVTTWQW